jgi:hypothetical protein
VNRSQRRAAAALSRDLAKERPRDLTIIPPEEWPPDRGRAPRPIQCWQSRKYLVQKFDAGEDSAAMFRLSICRVTLQTGGRWDEGLTWQELQDIKREIGFGDWYAIEIYPRDIDVIDVANMRHLWILASPLAIGWFSTP